MSMNAIHRGWALSRTVDYESDYIGTHTHRMQYYPSLYPKRACFIADKDIATFRDDEVLPHTSFSPSDIGTKISL